MPDEKATPPIFAPALGGGAERLRALIAQTKQRLARYANSYLLRSLAERDAANAEAAYYRDVVAALETPPAPPSQLISSILREYADDNTKAACDECEQCGELTMCKFHSVLSLLSGDTRLGGETPPAQEGAPHNRKK